MQVHGDEPCALHDDDLALVEVDAHDLGLAHLDAAEQLPKRHDRVGRMDAGRRDLGQQRLEHEIIVGIDQLDVELAAAVLFQRLRGEDPAEAAAEHQHLLLAGDRVGKVVVHGCPAFHAIPIPLPPWVKSRFVAPPTRFPAASVARPRGPRVAYPAQGDYVAGRSTRSSVG